MIRIARRACRRAFSIIELLIALTISALLLSACLVALDSSFKSYENTSESASTHVVTRLVMYRVLAMVRTGDQFGPYPTGIVVPTTIESDYIEFVSFEDPSTGERQVTRFERVDGGPGELASLVYTRWDYLNDELVSEVSHPMLTNLLGAQFTMEYDVGPVLRRATIDITVRPDDNEATAIESDMETAVIRLVASTGPRRLD